MPVFAVIASNDGPGLGLVISRKIASSDFHQVDDTTWFVSAPSGIVTPKELSDFLDISSGAVGRVLLMHVTSYFGFHKRETWDWLSIKGV